MCFKNSCVTEVELTKYLTHVVNDSHLNTQKF